MLSFFNKIKNSIMALMLYKEKENKKTKDIKLSRVFYYYWKFMKNYKWGFIIIFILYSIGNIIQSNIVPLFYKKITDLMVTKSTLPEILNVFYIIIFLSFLVIIFFRFANYIFVRKQLTIMKNIDNDNFQKISTKSMGFFENSFTGALVNKSNKFVRSFESITDILFYSLLWNLVLAITTIGILFFISIPIALIFLAWIFLYFPFLIFFTKKMLQYDFITSQKGTEKTGMLSDIFTNILNLKIFSAAKKESFQYKKKVRENAQAQLKSWDIGILQELIMSLLFLVLQFSAMGSAFYFWSLDEITIGTVLLVQLYFFAFMYSFWGMSRALKNLITAISDAKEMIEILDQKKEVKNIENSKKIKIKNGEIIFKNISFSYPKQEEKIFNKLSLTIPAGQQLGLVGTSGSGKTTITKLILRFTNLNSGKILIDKQDISQVSQDSLRESIAYVPQEPVLFHRSIYENIAYAKKGVTKKEVFSATKKAHADEFIQKLENGYETLVGERGVKLSGGQRQRVALARAFLKNAPILILDEATAALDSVSEKFIQDALFKLMKNKTVIVVAHRLSTIQSLDRILVIENGEIVEDGDHQNLIQKKGIYQAFWEKQTTKFV